MANYNNKKILIGLSGGINSMAVLCWLVETGFKPSELHLFYAHFNEHSPDTFQFVADGMRYAKKHFNVKIKITRNSILNYFRQNKMIPHPANGACSKHLKIVPISVYMFDNEIFIDLIGYVKHEIKRRKRGQKKNFDNNLFAVNKEFPISNFSDEWCFEIVKKHIGWYPKIYDIKNADGKRLFKHNNCLPCKNMYPDDYELIRVYYPEYYESAKKLSEEINKYWGRAEANFYSSFGRDLGQESSCEICKF
jgi:hypothetical protein